MRKLNILCIDDNPLDLKFLDLLYFSHRRETIQMLCGGSVAEAMQIASKNEIDVCLLDLELPDSNGLEGIRSFSSQFPAMPVVLVTGKKGWSGVHEALRSGVHDYLEKGGFTDKALQRVIEHAIEKGEYRKKLLAAEAQLKSLNANLRAMNDRAEAASAAKSQFLSVMSHEIRTPLNTIIGVADLLLDTPLTGRQRECVDLFQRSGNHLLALINQVLDLSKIEAGDLTVQECPWEFRELWSEVTDWAAMSSTSKALEFVSELDPLLPNDVLGDPQLIRQVLMNLVGNALKFTERGSIRLEVKALEVPAAGSNVPWNVRFRVIDTGIGIAPENVEAIFREFTQADQSITRRFGGTGLGLAISKRFVEKMGGHLQVESQHGVGSRFEFTLPLRFKKLISTPVLAERKESSKEKSPDGRNQRILIAEDVSDNRLLLSAYLSEQPFDIEFVENGLLALDRIKSGGFDLVLMDLQMPVMDGYSATKQIREWEAEEKLPRTPIIALTAHAFNEDVDRAVRSGCDTCLSKPIRRTKLVSEIWTHLGMAVEPTEMTKRSAS